MVFLFIHSNKMYKYRYLFVSFLLSFLPVYGELVISEVYIQWYNERIEIYNTSDQQFSWSVAFSWAKSSPVNLANITIPANDVIIVGDTLDMIQDSSKIIQDWLWLSLTDTQAADITLFDSSGQMLDNVYIPIDIVETMVSQKASRHKIFINPIQESITTSAYTTNIDEPYLANPWIVYTQEQTEPWDIPQLLITEVYFEWPNERIELTNNGDQTFQWEIELQWAGQWSKRFTLSIQAGESIVIADNNMQDMFLDSWVVQLFDAWFIINDDGNIDISLLFNGTQLDIFDVEEELVLPYIDDPNSFEKVLYQGERVITVTTEERIYNILSWYIANPGNTYQVNQSPTQIQEQTEEDSCDMPTQDIYITEVYKGSENYASYIEVYLSTVITDTITISWEVLYSSIQFDINHQPGYYILTNTPSDFIWDNIIQAAVQLSWNGQLTIHRQNGQVLDKVDISLDTEITDNQSLSFTQTVDCIRDISTIVSFSPWFDAAYLEYFPEGQTITQTVYVWGWGWSSCPAEEQETEPNITDDESTQTWSQQETWIIQIVDIDYDPPWSDYNNETITLQSFADNTIDLSAYKLSVSTRSSQIQLSGSLYSGETQTYTDNYRFPNPGACINLLFWDNVLDTYCYWNEQTNEQNEEEDLVSEDQNIPWQYNDYRNSVIEINNIDYDPPWSDYNNETITFTILSWWVDFSQMYLLINERTYNMTSFTWYITTGSVSFTANFRFPNPGACVHLVYEDTVFDTYCYDPNQASSSSQEESIDYSTYVIRIKEIIYDPPGNDKDRESITLQMFSWSTVDLSDFRLKVKTSNRIIQGSLSPWPEETFVWNYRMPNDGGCISLTRNDHIFDTICYTPTQDTQENEESIDYSNHTIKINHIDYDPPWADTDHETIQLFFNPYVFLSDDFYLLINDTKRYLRHFTWEYQWDVLLTGNFRFPNRKDACVRIWQESFIFDEYCYVVGETQEDSQEPDNLPTISIQAVFPNPVWADSDQEYVVLRLHTQESIDLSEWYTLSINGRNKTLDWELTYWKNTQIIWTLWLPNTATCVSLLYDKTITLDTFCYELPKEWYEYRYSENWLEWLSTIDLTVLKSIQFKQEWNKVCIRYDNVLISCRNNRIRISKEADKEIRLYKNYINTMHDYMINQRSSLFYNSSLVLYRDLLRESENLLARWITQEQSKYWPVAVTDISARFDLQYNQSFLDYLSSHIPQVPWMQTRHARYNSIKDDRYLQLLTKR